MYSDIAPDGKNEILAALENDGLADALPQALSEDEANALIAESKTNSGAALQIETVKRLAATQAANPPLFGRIYAALPNKVWLRKALSDLNASLSETPVSTCPPRDCATTARKPKCGH